MTCPRGWSGRGRSGRRPADRGRIGRPRSRASVRSGRAPRRRTERRSGGQPAQEPVPARRAPAGTRHRRADGSRSAPAARRTRRRAARPPRPGPAGPALVPRPPRRRRGGRRPGCVAIAGCQALEESPRQVAGCLDERMAGELIMRPRLSGVRRPREAAQPRAGATPRGRAGHDEDGCTARSRIRITGTSASCELMPAGPKAMRRTAARQPVPSVQIRHPCCTPGHRRPAASTWTCHSGTTGRSTNRRPSFTQVTVGT